jgi:hypothetical protein
MSLDSWDESKSKILTGLATRGFRVVGAVIAPSSLRVAPQRSLRRGAWGDPERWAFTHLGEGNMDPNKRSKDVHVRAYMRVRLGRQVFVREHWRRWPRQLILPF